MAVTLARLDPTGEDHDALVDFMTRNEFPFHVRPRPTAADVETLINDGAYRDEDNDSFWIEHSELGRIGFLRFEDLSDGAPLFDLRLDTPLRGRGLAAPILRAATHLVFSTMPNVNRFEGQTREDNTAMQDLPALRLAQGSALPRRLARGRRRTGCLDRLQHHPPRLADRPHHHLRLGRPNRLSERPVISCGARTLTVPQRNGEREPATGIRSATGPVRQSG